jgi:hypothetical protein
MCVYAVLYCDVMWEIGDGRCSSVWPRDAHGSVRHSIQVEFVKQDGSEGYLFSGVTRKKSKDQADGAGHTLFRIRSLDRRSHPVVKVMLAGRESLSDFSVFLYHYDLLRDTTPD